MRKISIIISILLLSLVFSISCEKKREWKKSEVEERQDILEKVGQDTTIPNDIKVVPNNEE